MDNPFQNAPPSPTVAVAKIFHTSTQLMHFIGLVEDTFDLAINAAGVGNRLKKEHGESVDLGQWAAIAKEADRIAGMALVNRITSNSYVQGLGAVRLVTAIDVGINDLAIEVLKRRWKSIAGVSDALPHDQEPTNKQLRSMKSTLWTKAKAKDKHGIGQYEGGLAAVGLDGTVPDTLGEVILELMETRRIIVHYDGRPDDRFRERCPQVPIWGGGGLLVTKQDFFAFVVAALGYMAELNVRLEENGLIDEPLEINWKEKRLQLFGQVEQMAKRPRAKTTQSPGDVVLGIDEFERDMSRKHGR